MPDTTEIVFFFAIPLTFLALATGVTCLAKRGQSPGWWVMVAGTLIGALGGFGELAFMIRDHGRCPPQAWSDVAWQSLFVGLLVFSIGFAINGWSQRRCRARISQLELINLAQATELEQIRNR